MSNCKLDGMQVQTNSSTLYFKMSPRRTYPGDFNCHEADATSEKGLSKAWWRDQMDEHSAKVIEIERLTGLRVSQTQSNTNSNRLLFSSSNQKQSIHQSQCHFELS